jgi:uncharacterized protein YjbI with pentapeptide repeats
VTGKELLRRYARGERDFRGIVLRKGNLSEAILVGSHFEDADFSEASLFGTCFYRACLDNAKICAADMRMADLRLANTSGVQWTDTDQTKVIWTDEDLWDDTRWG